MSVENIAKALQLQEIALGIRLNRAFAEVHTSMEQAELEHLKHEPHEVVQSLQRAQAAVVEALTMAAGLATLAEVRTVMEAS